jgi:cytochrome c-type biogenesis protein CcmH/NrfG
VLLDQKRTKRMVQVVAVLTSIAFVGVIFVVVGFIVFGGADNSASNELRADAQERIDADPNDPEAWLALAAAEANAENPAAALEAAQTAASLDEESFEITRTVVTYQLATGDLPAAVETLQAYTQANPENAEAFFQLGFTADQAGQTNLARLSYQRYLALAPDGEFASDARDRLEGIAEGEPAPGAPAPAPAEAGGQSG